MERGTSEAKVADKSETVRGSSSEAATAAPPGPERGQEREKTLPLSSIDLTHYHHIKSFLRQRQGCSWSLLWAFEAVAENPPSTHLTSVNVRSSL